MDREMAQIIRSRREAEHKPVTRTIVMQDEEFEVIVLRGTIYDMETRGVSFGKNTNSFLYDATKHAINGMPRYDTVVVRVLPPDDQKSYFGNLCRKEFWNSTFEEAIAKFGEFAKGDYVEILIKEANVPVSIAKI